MIDLSSYLTPSLAVLIGLTLFLSLLTQSLDLGSLVSFIVSMTVSGLTLYLTRDPISGLIVFSVYGLLTLRDSIKTQ